MARARLDAAAVVLSLGGDPVPLLGESDPVLVGLWLKVVEKATNYALARDRRQAIDVALLVNGQGKKLPKLEV